MTQRLVAAAARWAQAALWVPVGYVAVVTVAGLRRPRRVDPVPELQHLVVVIPAHDEQASIEETVRTVVEADYDPARRRVLVIADNCSDATAERATRAGAEVWERRDPERRGKGAALAWALERLHEEPDWETVVMVDADTRVDPGFLRAVNAHRAAGATALQAEYTVANADASVVARLAEVSFAIHSVLRQRGRAALGGAAKLQGNGMAFSREIADPRDWNSDALTEDLDAWLTLVRRGVRPRFAADARVAGLMPTTMSAARIQRARWEAGRLQLMRRHLLPGLRESLARRDPVILEAIGSELVVPPPTTLAGAILGAGLLRRLTAGHTGSAPAQAVVLGLHALAALIVSRASPKTYAALAVAPVAIAWKLALRLELAAGRRPTTWAKTPRPE